MEKIEMPVLDENTTIYVIDGKKNIMRNKKAVAFMIGLCIGILIFAYEHIFSSDCADIIDVQQIKVIRGIDIKNSGVVQYIFHIRVKQLLLLILCSSSIIAPLFMYLITGYLGFGIGIVFLSALYQYGIKGIILGTMLFFPHGIFYLLIFLIIFYKIGKNGTKYYQKDIYENCIQRDRRTVFKRVVFGVGDLILVVMLLCLGILSEAYINIAIIKKAMLLF